MSPFDNVWFAYGIPAGALCFAAVSYLWLRRTAAEFDDKYGKGR